ncbi:MAG TPA: type II toxin-antitoxin system VapC family toxin [Solirubrobacteraceae bacterium]|nr:type II toxin-antitoxin system VapC family toxin [Solirubrobacteraceae bacterium]
MILLDANILIYASIESFPQHEACRAWLENAFARPAKVGLPWPSLLGFVRIVTNPRILDPPTSTRAAWARVEQWLKQPNAWIPAPTDRHRTMLSTLLGEDVRGDLIPDAHMAALALEHGLTVCSTDSDFARFAEVRWQNPLG